MENWKQVESVPRLEVSDLGNVRCAKTKRPWYTRVDKLGYVVGQYSVQGRKISFKVHRLIAKTFLCNPECYKEVNHIDGDKQNNKAVNLEWCSRSRNIKHSFDLKLNSVTGSRNPRAKLTEELVRSICEFFAESLENTPKRAVEKFGISTQQATKIRAKISWKHVSASYLFPKLR